MNRAAGQGGFTLIELIVGLTISSVVIAAGFATLGIVRDRGYAAEATNLSALSGATQRAMLMDWLASASFEAPGGEEFQGLDAEAQGVPSDELIFPTTARTPLSNVFTVVRLYMDDDPATVETGLVAELTGEALSAEPRRMEIEPLAGAIQIRYLPEADGANEWVDGWIGRETLPRGIEIVLLPAVGSELPELLQLPVRVALPSAR